MAATDSTRFHLTKSPGTAAAPTSAALQIELRFHLRLPPTDAFDMVTFRLPEWFGQIDQVTWDNARSERGPAEAGVCSTRACVIGGKVLYEDIAAFEAGRLYAYRADMARSTMKMPIRDHLGMFEVEAADGGSLVTWRQYFRPPFWPLGAVVRWYMRDRMMRPAVKALLTKHGGAFR